MKTKGIFVTGTDTGIGKTFVSAALLSVLRNGNIDAIPMKPVQTGCVRNGRHWLSPDLEFCLGTAGISASRQQKLLMVPYCFKKACSPHLSAGEARQKIKFRKIIDAFQSLQHDHEIVIVEGVGGVLVPIDQETFVLDLMAAMALPVVLVSRAGLGTINHTLLSLRELRRAGLTVLGVIINETRSNSSGPGIIEKDNIKTIERMGNVRVLANLPHMQGLSAGDIQPELFQRYCLKHLPPVKTLIQWIDMKK